MKVPAFDHGSRDDGIGVRGFDFLRSHQMVNEMTWRPMLRRNQISCLVNTPCISLKDQGFASHTQITFDMLQSHHRNAAPGLWNIRESNDENLAGCSYCSKTVHARLHACYVNGCYAYFPSIGSRANDFSLHVHHFDGTYAFLQAY